MTAELSATNPRDIEFTLKITMKLRDWISLREQMTNAYPSWKLSYEISDMVHLAEKTFTPPAPSEPTDAHTTA